MAESDPETSSTLETAVAVVESDLEEIELETSLRFGACEMTLRDVLNLGPGDVIELNRHVLDPVDLLVGDRIVATGVVVVVKGNYGIRITEVLQGKRSLESIRCLF